MITLTTLAVITVLCGLAAQPTKQRAQAIRCTGRRLVGRWYVSLPPTPQGRVDAYVARMPIAVIAG